MQASENSSTVCQRIRLSGVVQGVGFRPLVLRLSKELKLTGWVRNRMDGSVELEAQGEGIDLERFENAVEAGPRWSRVEHVDIDVVPLASGERDFSVRSDR